MVVEWNNLFVPCIVVPRNPYIIFFLMSEASDYACIRRKKIKLGSSELQVFRVFKTSSSEPFVFQKHKSSASRLVHQNFCLQIFITWFLDRVSDFTLQSLLKRFATVHQNLYSAEVKLGLF
ncbi:unnamed protein product [Vicia faba]|uniref:Uncharacterized protein n=1 Tax=Vicia faba TaxID=3906 RepID=A0AAV1AX74_VICFA|nr:unnamed protein product [Vicia faba]